MRLNGFERQLFADANLKREPPVILRRIHAQQRARHWSDGQRRVPVRQSPQSDGALSRDFGVRR